MNRSKSNQRFGGFQILGIDPVLDPDGGKLKHMDDDKDSKTNVNQYLK